MTIQKVLCAAVFAGCTSVCAQSHDPQLNALEAFKRINALQQEYEAQYYKDSSGRMIGVFDATKSYSALHIADVTRPRRSDALEFFLRSSGKIDSISPTLNGLSAILDALSPNTLLTVDPADGAKLKRLLDPDQNHGASVDVRTFVVRDFGEINIERLTPATCAPTGRDIPEGCQLLSHNEGKETYQLTFPGPSSSGKRTMTVTSAGKFLGGMVRDPGHRPQKESASACKYSLLLLYDMAALE
jgi:hypothetical protein